MPNLENKIAIVTGSAQGIGKAIAEQLSAAGAKVIVSDVHVGKGRATAEALGRDAVFIPCDIGDYEQVEKLVDATVERFGRLDIIVNNAGYHTADPKSRVTVDKYPLETWQQVMDISLTGTFHCCRAAAARMVEQGSGCIVNIASVAGVAALRLQIGHVASKAAIIKMTEAMACELGPMGIRVNTISPGSIVTDATRKLFYSSEGTQSEMAERMLSFVPQRRPGEPSEIADAVLYLVSDAASYVNGHNLVVDGGWTAGFTRDF